MRGGTQYQTSGGRAARISIHPPRAGRDVALSRLTAWRLYFNPPAPCGAGRLPPRPSNRGRRISIHPPRAGRDLSAGLAEWIYHNFNPPAPCGAGRLCDCRQHDGGDNFNPPAPCGAGRESFIRTLPTIQFQSTRPVRGGTCWRVLCHNGSPISIHPPRAGRDYGIPRNDVYREISIHPPRAGRDFCNEDLKQVYHISIHPPRAGRDDGRPFPSRQLSYFNPPAPCGAGLALLIRSVLASKFQSTRPVRGGTIGTSVPGFRLTYFNPPAPCGAGPGSWAIMP